VHWLNGSKRDLGSLGGPNTVSRANAISDNDLITGTSAIATGQLHAAVWKLDGSMSDLGTLGGASSEAYGINSVGNAIVGFAFTKDSRTHAFLYSDQFGMIDLNSVIPSNSGWELTEARGVNNEGEIAGTGVHNGTVHAFLLQPIAPPPCGSDITNEVAVARGGFRVNPSNGHFTQSLTVTNIGSSAIAGPIAVTLDGLSSYASLANASGSTTCATPAGSPYLLLNLGTAAALAPNASVSALLDFINPPKQGIEYSVRVLAGNRY
jgi:probable HAF family extracellular repeat protein